MLKIAIFGGTFNPFHIGHYEILESLCESDMFDKVLVIPDKTPPHKEKSSATPDSDRIEMCRIVCDDFDKAQLCLIEFEREGKSYTVDTVKALKKQYENADFFVACGGDMIKTLDTWYDFDTLKKIASFVAFGRGNDPGFSNDVNRMRALGAEIIVFDTPITNVSSTELRKNLKPQFLPKKVCDYVSERGIYKWENS